MSLSYNGDGGGARVLGKLEEDHSFWMCCFTWPTCNSSGCVAILIRGKQGRDNGYGTPTKQVFFADSKGYRAK